MKGNPQIIDILNEVLTAELTGINQYFVHAKMCENWGYQRLYEKLRHESIDEMKHADELIDRILFLEGVPNVQRLFKINVGETVPEQLKSDLAVEREAVDRLNKAIELCRSLGDHGSRHMLEEMLTSEESHLDWIEEQLGLIDKLGEANYLAQQLKS
jgi:bacterioferritin